MPGGRYGLKRFATDPEHNNVIACMRSSMTAIACTLRWRNLAAARLMAEFAVRKRADHAGSSPDLAHDAHERIAADLDRAGFATALYRDLGGFHAAVPPPPRREIPPRCGEPGIP